MTRHHHRRRRDASARLVALLAAAAALSGCETYPPASEVAACAASRFGTDLGDFSATQRSPSEEVIVYAKRGSPDVAIVVYTRSQGPVSTHQEISFGNHAEIMGAIEAIQFCSHPSTREKGKTGP